MRISNLKKLIIVPGKMPDEDEGVVPAYYDYPLTIQGAGDDVADANWGQSEGTRQSRQSMRERLKETLGE